MPRPSRWVTAPSQSPALSPDARWPATRRRVCLTFGLWPLAAGVLQGCATKPPKPPKPNLLTVDVQAAANINPSTGGRPSPVVVRIYELKASAQFETAGFIALFDKDQALLGGDVVVRDEFFLNPGESKTLRRDLGSESKFLAAMVAFRDLERARWRAVVPMLTGSDNAFLVQLNASDVQVSRR